MISVESSLIILAGLLLTSAFFSAAETSFMSISRIKLKKLAESKNRNAEIALQLMQDPHRLLTTILLCSNLANIAASAIATDLALKIFPGEFALAIVTGVMTFLILVFTDITPKSISLKHNCPDNIVEYNEVRRTNLATRDTGSEISKALPDVIAACKVAGFDFIVVETSGIGQGDAAIVPLVDVSLYVMTPEFGAASQLEKIDMLDFADFVAINKFDRKGAADALRDVRKQYQRNRERFNEKPEDMPVFGTQAARFNDDGVSALYQALLPALAAHGLKLIYLGLESGCQEILDSCRKKSGVEEMVAGVQCAAAAGIKEVVFDRGKKKYHGRVMALALAMRENGLIF